MISAASIFHCFIAPSMFTESPLDLWVSGSGKG